MLSVRVAPKSGQLCLDVARVSARDCRCGRSGLQRTRTAIAWPSHGHEGWLATQQCENQIGAPVSARSRRIRRQGRLRARSRFARPKGRHQNASGDAQPTRPIERGISFAWDRVDDPVAGSHHSRAGSYRALSSAARTQHGRDARPACCPFASRAASLMSRGASLRCARSVCRARIASALARLGIASTIVWLGRIHSHAGV